jgi:hypothetical protein
VALFLQAFAGHRRVDKHSEDLVLSYTRVRTALGLLGLALPLVLIVGGLFDEPRLENSQGIEATISDFYHTTYRDIFVGCLCAIGVFLISYRGYRRAPGDWISDDWLATSAGVAAFGLAFFPNEGGGMAITSMTQRAVGTDLSPVLHYSFALIFFSSLAAFCLVKFSRTAKPGKRRIYRFCGHTILASMLATAICVVLKRWVGGGGRELVLEYKLIFWFEAIGIWAFALSWLIKGRADLALARMGRKRRVLTQDMLDDREDHA